MTKYKTKSAIIGRKRDKEGMFCAFIALFNINDPHKSAKVPTKILEFKGARNVRIKGCEIKYMIPGNDLILNDLDGIDVVEEHNRIYITAVQKKSKERNQ